MEPSDTFMAILEEGEAIASREVVLAVGEERFGPPPEAVQTQLKQITDVDRRKRMVRRAVKAASWQEILETP